MKKLILLYLASVVFVACSSDKSSEPYINDFTISENALTFTPNSETKEVSIDIDGIWKIVVEDEKGNYVTKLPDWIEISPASGSGKHTISISTENNLKAISRTAKLAVFGTYDYKPQYLEVVQEPLGADYESAIELGIDKIIALERSESGYIEMNVKFSGTVVNDPNGGNFMADKMVLQSEDSRTGIIISKPADGEFPTYGMNDIIEVCMLEAKAIEIDGQLCFQPSSHTKIIKTGNAPQAVTPIKCTLKDIALGKFAASLVSIDGVQFSDINSTFGAKSNHLLRDNVSIAKVKAGVLPTANFGSETLPAGNGSITGIVYGGKLMMRNISDCTVSSNSEDRGEEINPELVMWNFNGGTSLPASEVMQPRRGRFMTSSKVAASHEKENDFAGYTVQNTNKDSFEAKHMFRIDKENRSIVIATGFTPERYWQFETSTFGVSGAVKLEFGVRIWGDGAPAIGGGKFFKLEWANNPNASTWNSATILPAPPNATVKFNTNWTADNKAEVILNDIKGYSRVYIRIRNTDILPHHNFALGYFTLTEMLN